MYLIIYSTYLVNIDVNNYIDIFNIFFYDHFYFFHNFISNYLEEYDLQYSYISKDNSIISDNILKEIILPKYLFINGMILDAFFLLMDL